MNVFLNLKNNTTNTCFWLIFFLFFLILNNLSISPIGILGLSFDDEIFRYVAKVLELGGVLGVDVFDNKPPFTYYMAYLGNMLYVGSWGIWIVRIALCWLACCFLFFALKKHFSIKEALLFVLVYILLISFESFSYFGFSRLIICNFYVIYLSLFLLSKRSVSFYFHGFILFLVLITIPNDLLGFLPVALFITLYKSYDDIVLSPPSVVVKRILKQFVGFFIPLIFLLYYYYLNDFLWPYYDAVFLYNVNTYVETSSFWDRFIYTFKLHFIYHPREWLSYYFLLITFIPMLYLSKMTKIFRTTYLVLFFAVILQFISVSLSGRGFIHYKYSILPIWFSLIILFYYGLKKETIIILPNRKQFVKTVFTYTFLIFISLLTLSRIMYFTHRKFFTEKENNGYKEDKVLIDKIKAAKTQQAFPFFSFHNEWNLSIYTDLNIMAPTPYFYRYRWALNQNFDADGTVFDQVIHDINKKQTMYILTYPLDYIIRESSEGVDLNKKWKNFIQKYYTLDYILQDGQQAYLYKRKNMH